MLNKKALAATAAGAEPVYVEDVFQSWLYTGNGSTQTINNGIDLAGKGGMVWIKSRSDSSEQEIFDTARGRAYNLSTSRAGGKIAQRGPSGAANDLTAFTTSGFSVGAPSLTTVNDNSSAFVSWTFRKAPKFFDVVTYTGNGVPRNISHSLGVAPGLVVIKCTSAAGDWLVYSVAAAKKLLLNTTAAGVANDFLDGFDASVFSIGGTGTSNTLANTTSATYVAYLFAHDPSADGIIQCGSYTGNGSTTGPVISLGWEPQYLMIKNASGTGNWQIIDNMRGMPVGSADATLQANLSNAESSVDYVSPTATGFQVTSTSSEVNTNGNTYIYMAIRRPNKPPTSGTEVFMPTVYTGTNVDNRLVNTTIAPDMVMVRQRNDAVLTGMVVGDRLRGNPYLLTGDTAAEVADADSFMTPTVGYGNSFSAMNGFGVGNDPTSKLNINTTANNHVALAFRRAPGFFDVVVWNFVNSNNLVVPHSLGVVPELIISKARGISDYWFVYSSALGLSKHLLLQMDVGGISDAPAMWSATPTATQFNINASGYINPSAGTSVAYLFATLPGISKVGSYTGNGSSQTINCGFTTGARFVMIKRTDSTGDWYVWDSARGIVAGNDPHLSLNTTAAEVTTDDSVDTDSTGFIVNQVTATNVNVNAATYIYLAIA